jgi:formiminotetrahydrofolate cyclodeaminase
MKEIRKFCEKLGSKDPVPGGGAAAGITLSLGVSCVEKAVRFSEGNYPDDLIDNLLEIKNNGFILMQKDQDAFLAWQKARRLPKNAKSRAEKIAKYSLESIIVPYDICNNCIRLIELIQIFQPYCSKWLASDAAIGVSFTKASFDAGLFNIMINKPFIKDERVKEQIDKFINEKVAYFNNFYEQLLAKFIVMLKK